jgi:hypothetical protein
MDSSVKESLTQPVEVALPYQDEPLAKSANRPAPENTPPDSGEVAPDLQEILREAQSRGSLIDQHPDLKPVSVSIDAPNYVAARPFHAAAAKAQDWRTAKAPERTGYSSPVDDPAWLESIQYRGKV